MDDETRDDEIIEQDATEELDGTAQDDAAEGHSDYKPVNRFDAAAVHHLSGMYQSWFLDYASYVILERAVPHIEDGLKPVQRRILHSMKRMDDGRYNKVANIVGHTMQFHPHGDASIGDALVQMGQKDLLIDTQGNWGNILTGNRAAAPRYIEARLSKFALDTVFNPKTTEWQMSYDGRNKEPITLPVKYPLLLAQGAEGIAVGLSSKILPHNFVEICDADGLVNPGKWLLSAVGSLVQPVFQHGQIVAGLKVAKMQYEQAFNKWQNSIYKAGNEVSNALVAYNSYAKKAELDGKRVEVMQKNVEDTKKLMESSTSTTYLEVITAQSNLLNAEISEVSDQLSKMQAVVSLYQALGGGAK